MAVSDKRKAAGIWSMKREVRHVLAIATPAEIKKLR